MTAKLATIPGPAAARERLAAGFNLPSYAGRAP